MSKLDSDWVTASAPALQKLQALFHKPFRYESRVLFTDG
jgi:hypothetical protein